MGNKFFIYQILGVGVIWAGMAFFFKEMDEMSKIIFYVVTSWLLFLIVVFVKKLYRDQQAKKNGKQNQTNDEGQ
ncbi:large-conductance mechanosensitive channel [Cerasibacillus quisquiliarum]|uniref:Uncharacterized protein n=1 Tax=Cerasibacillus quisquiliarum TaxID=227865 RepID=A0A511V0X0_9BACI|nr:hypothetical protein [Cerasibacillus quisquiliarum]MBB5146675.1 large-conductance mechanosensitive channel [Cerasibacillus quisquiliarum]GEN31373.1 hypothetical protein CQU01_16110 [Cerasibacillus quisquiliarum]